MSELLPDITPAMLKEAGLNSWLQEFMGKIGQQFTSKGYTFDQWRKAVQSYCYISESGGNGLMVRLRPQFDPEAKPCPNCNNSEIVMQPKDDRWYCPNCRAFEGDAPVRKPLYDPAIDPFADDSEEELH